MKPVAADASVWSSLMTVSVCLSVCLCIRALNGMRLVLSTPNLVDICSMTVARHALNLKSKGQRSRSRGYQICCWCGCSSPYDCSSFRVVAEVVCLKRAASKLATFYYFTIQRNLKNLKSLNTFSLISGYHHIFLPNLVAGGGRIITDSENSGPRPMCT